MTDEPWEGLLRNAKIIKLANAVLQLPRPEDASLAKPYMEAHLQDENSERSLRAPFEYYIQICSNASAPFESMTAAELAACMQSPNSLKTSRKVKPSTQWQRETVLLTLARFCWDKNRLDELEELRPHFAKPKKKTYAESVVTPEELRSMRAATNCAAEDLLKPRGRYVWLVRLTIELLIITGGRAAAVCAFRLCDLRWLSETRATLTVPAETKDGEVEAKGDRSTRKVDSALLRQWYEWRLSQGHSLDQPILPSAWHMEQHLETSAVRQRLKKLCRRLGLRAMHPHMMRHTLATDLFYTATSLNVVSEQLGQRPLSPSLNSYAHENPSRVESTLDGNRTWSAPLRREATMDQCCLGCKRLGSTGFRYCDGCGRLLPSSATA